MAEPILWCKPGAAGDKNRRIPARRFNPETRQMEDVIDEDTGARLFEKVPQRAHIAGDYENPVLDPRGFWMHVLRHDGHVVRVKLTNAAADRDIDAPGARERKAKARYFGWIPVGNCPLALILAGGINPGQVAAKHILKDHACPPSSYSETNHCPHYVEEEKARKARHAAQQAKLAKSFQGDADKLIAAQQQQTGEIVTAIADALKGQPQQAAVTPETISAIVAATVQALKESEGKPKR